MRSYRLYENVDPNAEISAEELYQANHFDYNMEISQVFDEIRDDIMKKGMGSCLDMQFIHNHDGSFYVKKHFEIMVIARILLGNAIDSGATKIVLTTDLTDSEMIMSVEDNGKGISNQDLPKVFNPRYKINPEKAQDNKYGLFNVRKAVISTKGKFKIDSKPGESTVCTVRFPLSCILSDPAENEEKKD